MIAPAIMHACDHCETLSPLMRCCSIVSAVLRISRGCQSPNFMRRRKSRNSLAPPASKSDRADRTISYHPRLVAHIIDDDTTVTDPGRDGVIVVCRRESLVRFGICRNPPFLRSIWMVSAVYCRLEFIVLLWSLAHSISSASMKLTFRPSR